MICMRELTKSANRTNGRSWSNQKPLHRGSRTCRPFAPNQFPVKEDRGFIDWLDYQPGNLSNVPILIHSKCKSIHSLSACSGVHKNLVPLSAPQARRSLTFF